MPDGPHALTSPGEGPCPVEWQWQEASSHFSCKIQVHTNINNTAQRGWAEHSRVWGLTCGITGPWRVTWGTIIGEHFLVLHSTVVHSVR